MVQKKEDTIQHVHIQVMKRMELRMELPDLEIWSVLTYYKHLC